MEKCTSSVRKTGVSLHNGRPIKGFKTLNTIVLWCSLKPFNMIVLWYSRSSLIGPKWCRETTVSRTFARLIVVVFSSLENIYIYTYLSIYIHILCIYKYIYIYLQRKDTLKLVTTIPVNWHIFRCVLNSHEFENFSDSFLFINERKLFLRHQTVIFSISRPRG